MHQLIHKSLCAVALRLLILILLVNAALVCPAWSLTPKEQYFRAENAYAALKKNIRHQKYRDRWLACIEKYQTVYRLDPSGPWAAAGLYKSGLLYLELHKHSYLEADRQQAVDAFRKVIPVSPKPLHPEIQTAAG